ncbi:MAG: hypothetical protein IPN04_11745 [Rhodoferax sp.]|nr:hypothetical protein [Rhodoferax sp.]
MLSEIGGFKQTSQALPRGGGGPLLYPHNTQTWLIVVKANAKIEKYTELVQDCAVACESR